jgi:hypothetical protein
VTFQQPQHFFPHVPEAGKGSKALDANRFVVRLALGVLTERYSYEVIMLSLGSGNC